MAHPPLRSRFFMGLLIVTAFSLVFAAFNVQAIGINNPIRDQDVVTMTGTITAVNEDTFEFMTDDGKMITVHVPQYVDVALLGLNVGDPVTVTGYLKVTQCDTIILPTIINNIVLEDLKPHIGIVQYLTK